MVKSSVQLCSQLSLKLLNTEKNSVNILKSAFSLALSAIECAHSAYEDKKDMAGRDEVISSLSKILEDWISNGYVVGRKVFGGSNPTLSYATRNSLQYWKGKKELMVSYYIYKYLLIQ